MNKKQAHTNRKPRKFMKKIFLYMVIAAFHVNTHGASFDRIIAVVDDKIILNSDLEEFENVYRNQPGFGALSEEERQSLILQKLIDQKLMLAVAEQDTAIIISDAELESRVKMYLERIIEENGGEVRFTTLLKQTNGKTVAEFKNQIKEQMKEEMLKQKLQEKYCGTLEPSILQIKEFYKEYQDSLQVFKNNYKISHLEMGIKPNAKLVKEGYNKCDSIIKLLDKGEDFSELARKFSDDPSGKEGGGDLGFTKRGVLDPDYENSAFRMKVGDYSSRPVQTQFGFHVIKLTGKKDVEIRTSHILIRINPTGDDTLKTIEFLDSLRNIALKKKNFSELAKKYSEDKKTRQNGGNLGWFTREQLEAEYLGIIDTLSESRISSPVLVEGKYHLFYVDKYLDERRPSIEDDWNQVSMVAKSYLINKKMSQFLEKWRQEIHIDIRLGKKDSKPE